MDLNHYLLIGGSTKCGTTSVFNYFEYHPGVCACLMKESRFFWQDDYALDAAPRNNSTVSSFSDLFRKCEKAAVRMEATPDYLYSEKSAKQIHESLPNCKMLFILREPVSRLQSWFGFALSNGLLSKDTTFDEYVKIQSQQIDKPAPQHLRALEQGKYHNYLEAYFQIFGKKNILIMYYEDLVQDPGTFCRNIAAFIGIDPDYFIGFEFRVFNKTVAAKSIGAQKLFRKIKRTIRPMTRIFPSGIRKSIKLAGHQLETVFKSANEDIMTREAIGNPTLNFLENYYLNENKKLESLTGNRVPW